MTTMMGKRWLPLMIAGVVLDLAISGVLAWLGVSTLSNAQKASNTAAATQKLSVSQYQNCTNTNDSRAAERKLWRALFSVALVQEQHQGLTPAQIEQSKAQVQQYLAIVDSTFVPLKCTPPPAPFTPANRG